MFRGRKLFQNLLFTAVTSSQALGADFTNPRFGRNLQKKIGTKTFSPRVMDKKIIQKLQKKLHDHSGQVMILMAYLLTY
jgi:hypothetical protein